MSQMHTIIIYIISTDIINCTHFNSNVQLGKNDTITVVANSLQSIVCKNTTPEISEISYYTFNPPAGRLTKDYIPLHKYEIKFFLNSSATLTIGGLHSTNDNDANYTLKINIQVIQGTQDLEIN